MKSSIKQIGPQFYEYIEACGCKFATMVPSRETPRKFKYLLCQAHQAGNEPFIRRAIEAVDARFRMLASLVKTMANLMDRHNAKPENRCDMCANRLSWMEGLCKECRELASRQKQ